MGEQKAITVESVMKAYCETRDLIKEKNDALEKELAPLQTFQKAREAWMTAQLDAAGVNSMAAAGVATAFFKKNEWVKVDDFHAFLKAEVFTPLAVALRGGLPTFSDEDIVNRISEVFPFELFKKDVVKEPILALMGDVVVEKDETGKVIKEGRPNPPPAGVSYGAKRVLQIHKK